MSSTRVQLKVVVKDRGKYPRMNSPGRTQHEAVLPTTFSHI